VTAQAAGSASATPARDVEARGGDPHIAVVDQEHRRSSLLATRALAKINLALHVLGRRADGYHELESLVAFASIGDALTLSPDGALSLQVEGATAARAGSLEQNLVLTAARNLADRHQGLRPGAFHLVKRLPVAAGIGGGSADAAAALRLLARLNSLPLDHPAVLAAARVTGADVPVCLASRARMMGGVGDRLGPVLKLPRLFVVLVNPGVTLETVKVFAALGLSPGQRCAAGSCPSIDAEVTGALPALLQEMRNDLEPAARTLAPVIDEALALTRATPGCRLARMSGSGPTVFGLFDDRPAAAAAAKLVRRARPAWWVKAAALR
jgi:4-diphosphocytidyl-2-C-methyl-D-erythritol kinase